MAKCNFCDSRIFVGGLRVEDRRFCNQKCLEGARDLALSRSIPAEVVLTRTSQVYNGSCPVCGGRGPVDVHKSYKVWSALFLTSWSTHPVISCRSCARKKQIGHLLFSGVFGWWGFPWGLVLTPVQVTRNLIACVWEPSKGKPSALLENFTRRMIAVEAAQQPRTPALPR